MNDKFKNLPLRSGVGIVLINKNNQIFVAKRIDNPKNFWQMPQGGVDEGEDFLTAAYRELEEETSIKNVELIKELDGLLTYHLPERLLGIIWKGKYQGQKQKWFLMKYLGKDNDINIKIDLIVILINAKRFTCYKKVIIKLFNSSTSNNFYSRVF